MYSSTLPSTSALDGGGWSTPRPCRCTPGKDPVPIVQEPGWAPGPVWTGAENLAPTEIRSPDRTACSESLYRLSYPSTHNTTCIRDNANILWYTTKHKNKLAYSFTQNYVLNVVNLAAVIFICGFFLMKICISNIIKDNEGWKSVKNTFQLSILLGHLTLSSVPLSSRIALLEFSDITYVSEITHTVLQGPQKLSRCSS